MMSDNFNANLRYICWLFVFMFDLLIYDRLSAIVPGYRHAKYIFVISVCGLEAVR